MGAAVYFVVDATLLPIALIQAVRAAEMTPAHVDIHVFCEDERSSRLDIPEAVAARTRGRLYLHPNRLLHRVPSNVQTAWHWPPVVYAWLFAPALLGYRRLLKMDVDILIERPLDELFSLDMRGRPLAAIQNAGPLRSTKQDAVGPKHLGQFEVWDPYFNSGIVLIDRDRWIDFDFTADIAQFSANHGKQVRFVDQDFVNVRFYGDWLSLSPRWNCQRGMLDVGLRDPVGPHVLHFTGPEKPWHTAMALLAPQLASSFDAMAVAAGFSSAELRSLQTPPSPGGLKTLRRATRRMMHVGGIITSHARERFAEWLALREHLLASMHGSIATGAFGDAFSLPPTLPTPTPIFDGRAFRVRQL